MCDKSTDNSKWVEGKQVPFPLKKLFTYSFVFGSAGSSSLHAFFSSCSEWGLLSGCSARASLCGGFSCCGA